MLLHGSNSRYDLTCCWKISVGTSSRQIDKPPFCCRVESHPQEEINTKSRVCYSSMIYVSFGEHLFPFPSPQFPRLLLFLSIFISFCPCCHQYVFFSPSLVSITSPSHGLPFSTPIFSPSLCPNLTSSVALPCVHSSLLSICTCYIWVCAQLGGSPSPPAQGLTFCKPPQQLS